MRLIIIGITLSLILGCSKKVIKSNEFGDPEPITIMESIIEKKLPDPIVEPIVTKEKLNIHEKVFFSFDSEYLKQDQRGVIDIIVKMISEYPNARVVLTGNACKIGSEDYNYRLGLRRANSVWKYLDMELPHYTEGQIVVASKGEEGCEAMNEDLYPQCRNVEIVINE